MSERHPAQLRICHQRIGSDPLDRPRPGSWRWCNLAAFAWCFDCGRYVCDLHYEARHTLHRTQPVSDE